MKNHDNALVRYSNDLETLRECCPRNGQQLELACQWVTEKTQNSQLLLQCVNGYIAIFIRHNENC